MRRENYTNHGHIKEFKNGNINVTFSRDAINKIFENGGHLSDIEILSWLLDSIDCDFIGDEFCLSNFDMGTMIYNCYSDLIYIISFSDIDNILKQGKTLKLYAKTPDDDDREEIERWRNN